MKVLHVTLRAAFSPGFANKLERQARASKNAGLNLDILWICGKHTPKDGTYRHMKIISIPHTNRLLIRWKQIQILGRLTCNYHAVILRYPCFDPVGFLLLKNTHSMVLEHHTLETEELRSQNDKRAIVERVFGGVWIRRFAGIIGVTPQIAEYELSRCKANLPSRFIPNAIDPLDFAVKHALVRDNDTEPLQLVMVASAFSTWHGLDLVTAHVKEVSTDISYRLHIVGSLCKELLKAIEDNPNIIAHGRKSQAELQSIYDNVHVGISSMGLHRQGLKEASTLKVREYLASGLPVVMGHRDPAFPHDFPFILHQESFDLEAINSWINSLSATPRSKIQEEARPFIDINVTNQKLVDFVTSLKPRT